MNQTKGSLYILASALFFGSYGVWSKLMAGAFGEFSQAWTRGLFLLISVTLANYVFKFFKPIKRKDLKWFIMIGLAGGLNQAPYFYGFEHLPVGTATLLFYAALVAGGYILGKLFFHEVLSSVKIISLILALTGMYSIYNFTLHIDQLVPAFFTVIAGLLGATGVVLSKKLSGYYPEIQIMTSYFICMILFNGFLSFMVHDPLPTSTQSWLVWLGYALTYVIANVSVIEGFKFIEASIGSLIGLAEIIFGLVFGIIFFHETVSSGTLLGTTLILSSAILPNITLKTTLPQQISS